LRSSPPARPCGSATSGGCALGIAHARGRECPVEPAGAGEAGEPAVAEGVKGTWRVDPSQLGQPFSGRAALLSPFDRRIQLIVHLPGRPALVPAVGHVVNGAPVRQVRGHRPPLDAFLDQIADGVHVITTAASRGAAALTGLPCRNGQRRLDDPPFRIAHVRRVPRHPRAAADPARAAAACHRRDGRTPTLGTRGSSTVLDRHKPGS
jgi:hypothetical protein